MTKKRKLTKLVGVMIDKETDELLTKTTDEAVGAWKEPVLARATTISSTPPGSPSEDDFYVDTDDNYLYKYESGSWNVDSTDMLEISKSEFIREVIKEKLIMNNRS